MPELVDIVVPEGQQEGTESTLMQWLKQSGDAVLEHEPLLELETDKVVVEVASPVTGVLCEILVDEQSNVEPGDVLGRIDASADVSAAAQSQTRDKSAESGRKKAADGGARLSPAVRRLIKKYGLDAARISGTGRDGRITHEDVENFIATREAASRLETEAPVLEGASLVPHSPMRRRIARHMVESMRVAPHVTSVFEVDMSAVATHRKTHRERLQADGIKLTYTAYFVQAAVAALKAVPEVNSRFHEDGLEVLEEINMGVGTALSDEGLIVPVIHGAENLNLEETAQRIQVLADKARKNQLEPFDVSGGTFTLSNHGVSGSLMAAPIIINQPQTAILGIGKLEKRVTVIEDGDEDRIEIRPMCYVTLTIDHRVLDAYQTNKYLALFANRLENWPD
jgi:2-oxoglutarate dehydrogenase E2 component (dihydrolipoamide succinyltransferase)